MAKLDETAHKKVATALADARISPAVMALHMIDENKYVNESFLQYMVNYIVMMANRDHVPMPLLEIQQQCKLLYLSLQELGLTGTVGRIPADRAEYAQV